MMATGGTQLQGVLGDDAVFAWSFHVDWEDPSKTRVEGPARIAVAPYPADDCTIWYVGDYYKAGATNYSTRIGAFRMPVCGSP